MTEASLQDLRNLTQYYRYLQGLKLVPTGVAVCVMGTAFAARVEPVALAILSLVLVAFAVGGYGLMWLVYRRRYGRVQEAPVQKKRSRKVILGSTLVGAVTGALSALPVLPRWTLGTLFGLMAAAIFTFYWDWSGRFLRHYPVIAAAVGLGSVVGAVLGGLGVVESSLVTGAGLVLCGAAFIAVGVLDHRWMVARMAPVSEADA